MLTIVRVTTAGLTADQIFEDCIEAAEAEYNYWKAQGVAVELIAVCEEAEGVQ